MFCQTNCNILTDTENEYVFTEQGYRAVFLILMIKQQVQHTLCYSHTYILYSLVINGKISLLNRPSGNVSKDCWEGQPWYGETILSDQLFACGILFSEQLLILRSKQPRCFGIWSCTHYVNIEGLVIFCFLAAFLEMNMRPFSQVVNRVK